VGGAIPALHDLAFATRLAEFQKTLVAIPAEQP
jgi:hypothetical protein